MGAVACACLPTTVVSQKSGPDGSIAVASVYKCRRHKCCRMWGTIATPSTIPRGPCCDRNIDRLLFRDFYVSLDPP